MMHSLRGRMLLSFVVVIAVTLATVMAFVMQSAREEFALYRELTDRLELTRMEHWLLGYYTSGDTWEGVQPFVEEMGVLYVQDIVVLDGAGKVVADSRRHIIDEDTDDEVPTRSERLYHAGELIGTVYVDSEPAVDTAFTDALATAINRSLLWGSVIAGAVALGLTWHFSRAIAAPIGALARAAERAGTGDLTIEVHSTNTTELDTVARSFNTMIASLRQAESRMRNLIADTAHELRTPLTNVIGYLEAIRDGLVDEGAGLASVEEEALLLAALVDDLQSLAQSDAGQAPLLLEPTNVGALVRRAVDGLLPMAKGVTIEVDYDEELPPVLLDGLRVGQVLANLVRNALLYTGPGGRVVVTAAREHDELLLIVEDTGAGISFDHLPHIFDRFYRVDSSRSRKTGGRGLGLSIARQLVEAHGGTITAESEPGAGSRFIVRLPLRGLAS